MTDTQAIRGPHDIEVGAGIHDHQRLKGRRMTTATINQERLNELTDRHLKEGAHNSPDEGMCVMEAVAYVAGEPFGDNPQCASPTIASMMRRWNDRLRTDADRDRLLKPLIPRLVGSRGSDEIEARRDRMIREWACTEAFPRALDAAGLTEHAEKVRATPNDEAVVRAARAAAYRERSERYRAIRKAVKAELAQRRPDVVVAAVADADVVVAADVAAVAVVAADADAAAAVAVAVAAAVAHAGSYAAYSAAYTAHREVFAERYDEVVRRSPVLASLASDLEQSALDLVDRMLALTEAQGFTSEEARDA
jgi:hypothetical protein